MTRKFKYFLIFLFFLLFVMVPISIYNLKPPSSPSQGFWRLVCKPIPKSVTEIQMDRRTRWWRGNHEYVFHFKIDEADLSLILNSWPFQEIQHFKYNHEIGMLSWEPIDFFKNLQLPSSRELYNIRSGESGPEWFNLEQWDNPQAYKYTVSGEVRRLRLLLYNKKLGEAYFIDCRSTD
jgi:hypothetical protein